MYYSQEEGIWRDKKTGYVQNLFDFVKTEPYIKRYYDYNTKNDSFYNMYIYFKKLGVKNHSEHLQIFNPALIGVNPRDPLLSDQVKDMIDKECRLNPWYFFREIVLVKVNKNRIPFDLNIGNYSAIWLMLRSQDIFFEAPRQIGKTFVVTTLLAYHLNFGGMNLNMTNIHYDENKAKDNVSKIKEVLDDLPPYLQYHQFELGKTDKNGKQMLKRRIDRGAKNRDFECRLFNNKLKTVVIGFDPDKANNAGRGNTDPFIFIDEIPHIKFNFKAIAALVQSMTTIRKRTREFGLHSGLWLLGTPGFLNTPYGKWMYERVQNDYIKVGINNLDIFSKTIEDLEKWRDTRGISTMFHIKFEFDLLGYDEEWLFDKARSEEVETIRREIMIKWEDDTGENPFSKRTLNMLENKAKVVQVEKTTFLGQEFLIYPRKEYLYKGNDLIDFLKYNCRNGFIVGVDSAYGRGGNSDKSTLVFVDARTGRVIATYGSNVINIDDYAILIISIMEQLKKNNMRAGFAIERNAGGETIIAMLKKLPEYQDYLIVYKTSDFKLATPGAIIDTNVMIGQNKMACDIGLSVTSKTRPLMMNRLSTLVEKYSEAIGVPVVVNEIMTLTVHKTPGNKEGKIAASDGCHDDYIMAMLHAYYAVFDNTTLLKIRNNIIIDTNSFIINNNVTILDVTNPVNSRIKTSYEQRGGKIDITYYDNLAKKFVSKMEAKNIEKEEKFNRRIRNENNPVDNYAEGFIINQGKDSLGTRNVKILTNEPIQNQKSTFDLFNVSGRQEVEEMLANNGRESFNNIRDAMNSRQKLNVTPINQGQMDNSDLFDLFSFQR